MTRAPACWRPPASLVHLPEGEAVRPSVFEVYGAPATYPPPSAPGFRRAWELGQLPQPAPPTPPALVPGLSSWDRMLLALVLCFGGVLLALLLGNGLGAETLGMVVGTGCFGTGFWLFYSVDRRDQLEQAAGYTSRATRFGLWRLSRDGRVLRAPDRSVPPPGWYPSPTFPGVLQRWDGPAWEPLPQFWWRREPQYFRRPEVPFL